MNFAEMTQEVQTIRPTAPKLELGFTPGRRLANKVALLNNVIRLNNLLANSFSGDKAIQIFFWYFRKQRAN